MSRGHHSELGRIKGAAFREFVAWWERERGSVTSALEGIPGDTAGLSADRPALGILPSHWYDARTVHHIIDELVGRPGEDAFWRLAEEGGRATMDATLRGFYRAVFSLVARPDRLSRHVQRFWDMHYDSGTIRVEPHGSNAHHNTISHWRGHHPFICALNFTGVVPMYEAMGCKNVRYHSHMCVSRGDAVCQNHVTWE